MKSYVKLLTFGKFLRLIESHFLFFAYFRVQLAYCLQQQDKNVEALTLYNDVLKSKYDE